MSVLTPQQPGIPVPTPSPVSAPYWSAAKDRTLLFQRCGGCGWIPPRPSRRCWRCPDGVLSWQESGGTGTLYSWTVVWRPQHPSFTVPYAPAVMAVDEGWWLVTSLVGCELADISAGMALQVEFHPAGGDIWLPYAAPRA